MIDNTIRLVVGSWKAYNECNARGLGSKWLNLEDFEDEEELIQELKEEGFTDLELEELFIQDYEGNIRLSNCDSINPVHLLKWLREADYFEDDDKADQIIIHSHEVVEEYFLRDLENDDIPEYYVYEGSKVEYVQSRFENCDAYGVPDWIVKYIDFEQMAEDDYDLNEIEFNGQDYTYTTY